MTTLIQQRAKSDCAICCIAMATSHTYEDVLRIALEGGWYVPEEGTRKDYAILEKLGYTYRFENGSLTDDSLITCRHRPWELNGHFWRETAWGRRTLMTVPSLNIPNSSHMIYYDGLRIWDPSLHKTYTKWEELEPKELILFRDKPVPSIKELVDRFLGWRLPEDFSPDAGISFKPTFNDHLPRPQKHNPTGTNLLNAEQAKAMFEYLLQRTIA